MLPLHQIAIIYNTIQYKNLSTKNIYIMFYYDTIMNETKEVPINSLDENFTSRLFMSTIRLFKAVPTTNQKKKNPSKSISTETIQHGWVFSPQVAANYTDKQLREMIEQISTEIGLTPAQMNSTFNKSWKKVRDAPYMQLLSEQLFHYMTTYGYEAMGVYDQSTVFIPNERFDVPEIEDGIKLFIINGYTKSQLKEKLIKLINSGIAMDNIDDIVTIATYVKFSEDDILEMKNKEVRIRLYHDLKLIPLNPTDLLRLAIYEGTGETLLIVNGKMRAAIGDSTADASDLFEQYDEHFGYKKLAEIFNRFKPLFLAFKNSNNNMIPIINRIGKLSKKYHRPMRSDMLNNITSMLKKGEPIYKSKLDPELNRVNIWRKIRLAQSLKYRIDGNKSIVYKVRNGKSYATTFEFGAIDDARKVYDIILDSVTKDLKHLKGKEFYIPENIVYSLPSTAKMFSGNIPVGSHVRVGKDMIFGIWWQNVDDHRIDLDLHGMSQNAGHIGWNITQRSGNRSLLRTGDITDAPNGATELFYINKDYEDSVLFTLNYFNFDPSVPVPYKLMVAEEHPNSFGKNYTIDPNNMKCLINSVIDVNQSTLGLGLVKDGECRFYFSESGLGNTNVVKGTEYINIARDYMMNYFTNQITFNEILSRVGAKIVTSPTSKSIDLSPESLEKDTFIRLLIK